MTTNERRDRLDDRQLLAIDLMVAGRRLSDVEQTAEVSHAQLWRWRSNPVFIAKLEERRTVEHERRIDGWWALTDAAIAGASELIAEGDPTAIMDVLRLSARGLTDVSYQAAAPGPAPKQLPEGQQPVETLFPCGSCGLRAKSAGGLKRHQKSKHGRQ